MIAAIQRLVLISVGTLCLTFLAVLFVRWAGQQQAFIEPPHTWFTFDNWTVEKPDVEQLCGGGGIKPAVTSHVVWIPVTFANGSWNLKCSSPRTLKDILAQSPHPNWLLFVDSHETLHLDSLVNDVEPFEKMKNFGVATHSQTVARYLRKKAPQWVYGADAATLLRLHMFASFWIETAFDFWPDFVVQIPGDKVSQLSEREMNELQRRKKRVIQVEFTP